jgi:hypothetical protein
MVAKRTLSHQPDIDDNEKASMRIRAASNDRLSDDALIVTPRRPASLNMTGVGRRISAQRYGDNSNITSCVSSAKCNFFGNRPWLTVCCAESAGNRGA